MRLEKLTLSPYGRFADLALSFRRDAPLHVVFGANEAGKTTALSALGDLLFGFPVQTTYGFRHDQKLLRIGGAIRLADGSLLELRRRKGNLNTLLDADDKPVSDVALLTALGAVDRRIFESEFGLTARALREGGSALLRAGGGLAETIAASSASLSALSKLRETLQSDADKLFTSRKVAGKDFYVALDAYEAADRKLREATVTADALKATNEKWRALSLKEAELKSDYEVATRHLAKLQRAERTHRKLKRLAVLSDELAAFVDLPCVDAASLEAWAAAQREDREIAARLSQLAAETATADAEIVALQVDEALLEEGAAIDGLSQGLSAVRKAREDLPRRLEARHQAVAQLDEIGRRLGLPGHAALLDRQPSDAELARARTAIDARKRADERLELARGEAERRRVDSERLLAASFAAARDPEPLSRRLAPLADHLADADRLRRERTAVEAEARTLAEGAVRLDPPVADLDALARAPLPDAVTLARAARREAELAEALRAAQRDVTEARRDAETAERALRTYERDAVGATRADWLYARERRDRAFDQLGLLLDGEAAERRERFEDARALVAAADALGDSVVADTERAARLQTAREDCSARRENLARAEANSARLEAERATAADEARALWAPADVAPRSAEAMARWAERAGALLQRRDALTTRRAEAAALAEKLAAAREVVARALADLGRSSPESFEAAYREAQAEREAMTQAWIAAREAMGARESAARAAEDAAGEAARWLDASRVLLADWPAAVAPLALGAEATVEAAEAALEAWRAVASPRQAMGREGRSIEGIEGDLQSFAASVAAMAAKVAPELSAARPEEALKQLGERLARARAAQQSRAQLLKTAAQRAARQRAENLRRESVVATLAAAAARLSASDPGALALALERLQKRRTLEDERAQLARDINEIGDGLDEAALGAEQGELDPSLLPGEIELARARQAELWQAIPEAARVVRDAQAAHDGLAQGRDAAGAARERNEARGAILDVAERWFLRQAAARLAGRAIERHRAAAQDPLIARAGELFRVATAESFQRLGTDYDDADRPTLVALRADGEKVKVEGLSEGARDQLFLALRLALLERRAGEALPFVGDDILASFDDSRTRMTLALLADFGRARQAILFTHHRHVANLAAAAGADVLEL